MISENKLDKFADENSMYLTLADGEEVDVTYDGYEVTKNPYDLTKDIVLYKVIKGTLPKVFKSGSVAVAKKMSKMLVGQRIRIKRMGTGTNTKYEILML